MTPERIAELRAVVQSLTAGIVEHPRSHAEDYAEMLDEIERLTAELDAAQLRSIEARNPGIDMDEVKRMRARSEYSITTWCPHCNVALPSSGVHICPRPYPVERAR